MSENLIYLKFNYEEAVMAKKDILSFEMDLLRILKKVKNYHNIRSEELRFKLKGIRFKIL